ncbi:MAG: response regulator [Alphaproteobacteria bacterium]|nr:response regulator [Alphaproteobacteria bacterium]
MSPKGWVCLHFALSRNISHSALMEDTESITYRLRDAREKAQSFFVELVKRANNFSEVIAYIFPDNDVILLARPNTFDEKEGLQILFREMAARIQKGFSDYCELAAELYNYQKFADHKFLTAQRMKAYEHMADGHKISSIGIRRGRRGYPLVMVVEDDRFTSSYAAHILNKNYEIILSRSGEQGISDYIEQAPDIVFLDIHLPGLSGHDTLQSIRAIDPKAFIVMLSVDAVKKNIMQASSNGAYSFLRKPFSKEKMIEMVKRSPFIQASSARKTTDTSAVQGEQSIH